MPGAKRERERRAALAAIDCHGESADRAAHSTRLGAGDRGATWRTDLHNRSDKEVAPGYLLSQKQGGLQRTLGAIGAFDDH